MPLCIEQVDAGQVPVIYEVLLFAGQVVVIMVYRWMVGTGFGRGVVGRRSSSSADRHEQATRGGRIR